MAPIRLGQCDGLLICMAAPRLGQSAPEPMLISPGDSIPSGASLHFRQPILVRPLGGWGAKKVAASRPTGLETRGNQLNEWATLNL